MLEKSPDLCFRPQEIVCIDRSDLRLFGEVIQMIPDRDRCWAKPLILAQLEDFQLIFRHDLREAPQLILPQYLFRSALDTEVLPLMGELFQVDPSPEATLLARQALHHFIGTLAIE
jgi:hypothetical protein